jgi:type I restriction enzyme S subunit
LPLPQNVGHAASEHLVRVRCRSRDDAFYLWGILASQPGYYSAIGTAFGSSIPSLDCGLVADLKVPWFDGEIRATTIQEAATMISAMSRAVVAETKAIAIVESAISGEDA